jgi:sterol 14-demethylase
MMDKVEALASAVGVPPLALVPLAFAAVLAALFVLDGLSHVVLKPFKSPPVIGAMPLVGGMAAFLRGPIGLMADAFPKYGEVFTGACSALSSTGRPQIRASLRGSSNDRFALRG